MHHTPSGNIIPQDIGSLLNEFYVTDFKPKMRGSFYSAKSREGLGSRESSQNPPVPSTKIKREAIKPVAILTQTSLAEKLQETPSSIPRPIKKLKVTPISSSKKLKKESEIDILEQGRPSPDKVI